MGSKVLRHFSAVALVVGCATDHDIATLGTHDVDEVCAELCKKSAECERPAPWCDESGCDDCVAQCKEDARGTDGLDLEDEYCQRLLEAAIDCAHDASCAYYFDGVGEQPASCLRADRASLACYPEDVEYVSTSSSSGGGGGFGGAGAFGGADAVGGVGGANGNASSGITVSTSTVSAGGVGPVTTVTNASATSTGSGRSLSPLPFHDGWAPIGDNDVGIQGAFYTFNDNETGGTSVIEPEEFTNSGDEICVSGVAGRIENGPDGTPAYADYWGTGIGFNLSQEAGNDTAFPYDAARHGVTGFSFEVGTFEFPDEPGELRFIVKVAGDDNDYCQTVMSAGTNVFMLKDLWQSCWEHDASNPTPDPSQLESLEWLYVTNTSASYSFSLCITALGVIID